MATCTVCGQWAGVGQTKHNPPCEAPVARIVNPEMDELIARLSPVLKSAARAGGIAGALTLIGASVAMGIAYSILHSLLR